MRIVQLVKGIIVVKLVVISSLVLFSWDDTTNYDARQNDDAVLTDTCSKLKDIPFHKIKPEMLSECEQSNTLLWDYIKFKHIIPPSELPYTFPLQPPGDILQKLWPMLKKLTEGHSKKVFVEAGASDGISASNTVWLEESHGWTGILIECHPEALPMLHERHRNAFVVNACLSKSKYPSKATLTSVDGWHYSSSLGNGTIFPNFAKSFTEYDVQTLPLYSILAALEVTCVDFFSLDIQSLEPYVLRTFPFDLVLVKVWVIEINLITSEEKDELVRLMQVNGYWVSTMLDNGNSDLVFFRKKVRR